MVPIIVMFLSLEGWLSKTAKKKDFEPTHTAVFSLVLPVIAEIRIVAYTNTK